MSWYLLRPIKLKYTFRLILEWNACRFEWNVLVVGWKIVGKFTGKCVDMRVACKKRTSKISSWTSFSAITIFGEWIPLPKTKRRRVHARWKINLPWPWWLINACLLLFVITFYHNLNFFINLGERKGKLQTFDWSHQRRLGKILPSVF